MTEELCMSLPNFGVKSRSCTRGLQVHQALLNELPWSFILTVMKIAA